MRKTTNDLCADIGYMSLTHFGEQLCGDHVEVAGQDGDWVIVLADGLGSGVKANILSTLTAKIISTMLAQGLSLACAVETIAATLPVCSERGIAYSTFSIIRLINNERAEIICYDNPGIILLRGGKNHELSYTQLSIGGKTIYRCDLAVCRDDVFLAVSDGVEYAGKDGVYNFRFGREDIIAYMETFLHIKFTAKTLCTLLLDEVNRLSEGKPFDDATVCAVWIRQRVPMNLAFGPPESFDDNSRMMALFFAKAGKHIVCGGTTSAIASRYLLKPLVPDVHVQDPDIPPTAHLEGADLVTEGVITLGQVLEYAKNYLEDNRSFEKWSYRKDGASQIARMLFEEATDINFFVGRAVNPAHRNDSLKLGIDVKLHLIEELSACLLKMGKKVKVSYF